MPDPSAQCGTGLQPVRDTSCGTGVSPVKRGRGATPRRLGHYKLAKPNPTGRYELEIRYRPLREWSTWSCSTGVSPAISVAAHSQLASAEDMAIDFFQRIGGFRILDDAIIRMFYESLSSYSAQELLWAIDAKAASLRGSTDRETAAKAKFRGGPESFFARGVDYWLAQSMEYKHHIAREREKKAKADAARRAADPALARAASERVQAQRDADERYRAAVSDDRAKRAAYSSALDRATLDDLSKAEYAAFEADALARHAQECRRLGEPFYRPADLEHLIARAARGRWMSDRDPRLARVRQSVPEPVYCSASAPPREGAQ